MPAILTERIAGSGPVTADRDRDGGGWAPGSSLRPGLGGPTDSGRSAPSGPGDYPPISGRPGRIPSGRPATHAVTDS